MEKFGEYQTQATMTMKKWETEDARLAYLGLGIAGEAGEVADIIKKHFSGTKPLDTERREKLMYEIGDVMWYIAALCNALDFKMGDVARANIEKLRKRHGESFSGYGKRD